MVIQYFPAQGYGQALQAHQARTTGPAEKQAEKKAYEARATDRIKNYYEPKEQSMGITISSRPGSGITIGEPGHGEDGKTRPMITSMSQEELDKKYPRFKTPPLPKRTKAVRLSANSLETEQSSVKHEQLQRFVTKDPAKTGLGGLRRFWNGDGTYLIDQHPLAFHGTIDQHPNGVDRTEQTWQATLKINQIRSGKTNEQRVKEACNCDTEHMKY